MCRWVSMYKQEVLLDTTMQQVKYLWGLASTVEMSMDLAVPGILSSKIWLLAVPDYSTLVNSWECRKVDTYAPIYRDYQM